MFTLLAVSIQILGSPIVSSEFIFDRAPFPTCHASTIVETHGHLLAAWFGGSHEGARDVGIWTSIRGISGWSGPKEVAIGRSSDGKALPCWNPVLFQPKHGPLMLFYKVGPGPAKWWGLWMRSGDGGATWSKAKRLPDGILGPIKNKPIELFDGTILCPSSDESHGWTAHMEWTTDLGQTWHSTGPINDAETIGAIQPSLLALDPSSIVAIGRTRQHKIFVTDSSDNGIVWSPMRLLSIPNPNSGIDAVRLRDGRCMIVYNATSDGRSPLNLAITRDPGDAASWKPVAVLEETKGSEFSYPAIIQTSDGLVHITYTWNRVKIKHVVVDPQLISIYQSRSQ